LSGSTVFQVRVIVVPISPNAGVYVVAALVAFAKVPVPPDHDPVPFVIAVIFTGVIPHAV
jgi:hypothetical protein